MGPKGRLQVCSKWRVLKRRSCRWTSQNGQGYIFGFLWLVLNWKWGQKIRDTSSDSSSPHHFGLNIVGVTGLSGEIAIWPPTSLIYGRLASWAGYYR